MITIALAKGRLAKTAMKLLEGIGIECSELKKESRKLLFFSDDEAYSFFLSKASDVPTYVDYGACDIGIVGKDTIIEENRNIYEVLDLGFGECRMVVAGPEEAKECLLNGSRIRVATKYPRIAKQYFEKSNRNVEIIKLNGSVELGPIVGLADVIVDIVESGSTLRENNLVILEEIVPLSARVIINTASMRVKHEEIDKFISNLRMCVEGD